MNKEADYAYRVMVQAEHAWAAEFANAGAEVYGLSPPRERYGEELPCRRRVILARNSEIPDMRAMVAARQYYAEVTGILEDGQLQSRGRGSRAVSPIMRYDPDAPGHRVPLCQDDDVMRHPVTEVVHTETDAYRGGPLTIEQLLEMIGGSDPTTTIEIDGVIHRLHHDAHGRAVGPEGLIFRQRSGAAHRLSVLDAAGYRRQVRVATVLVVGAPADVHVQAYAPRPRRSKYAVEYRTVGDIAVQCSGSDDERVLTALLPR
ncbi:hypothetical protein NHG85_10240 [Limimaricola sp. ASW11-118]|uniref:Uncharacterized protein n=1 Tax=Limimaricola litoreus TaxID=2955316 RepID=A0A9X2JNW8_9RHOB|nr:hypothetical protein [Limimaricola litoreus]